MDLPSDELLSPLGSTRGTSAKALSIHSFPLHAVEQTPQTTSLHKP